MLSLQKIMGGHETPREAGAKLGGVSPQPGPKTVTGKNVSLGPTLALDWPKAERVFKYIAVILLKF